MNETFEAVVRQGTGLPEVFVLGGITLSILMAIGVASLRDFVRSRRANVSARREPPAFLIIAALFLVGAVGGLAGNLVRSEVERDMSALVHAQAVDGYTITADTDGWLTATGAGLPAEGYNRSDLRVGDKVIGVRFDPTTFAPVFVRDTGQDARTAVEEAYRLAIDPEHSAADLAGEHGRTDWKKATK